MANMDNETKEIFSPISTEQVVKSFGKDLVHSSIGENSDENQSQNINGKPLISQLSNDRLEYYANSGQAVRSMKRKEEGHNSLSEGSQQNTRSAVEHPNLI